MSKYVERLPHSCGTRRGLQVFHNEDGSYTGFCYSCGTFVKNPYKDKPKGFKPVYKAKTEEEIKAEIEELSSCPYIGAADRQLGAGALKYFGVTTSLSEENGKTPIARNFPYKTLSGDKAYKVKLISVKKMWSVGPMKDVYPFGWEQAIASGNRRLIITEGEEDAIAMTKMINMYHKGTQYADKQPAVVSLPHGAQAGANDLLKIKGEIDKYFKEIVLALDGDEPGVKATEEIVKHFPNAMSAKLMCKDANDCLREGYIKQTATEVLFRAAVPKNTRLVWGSDIHEQAKEKAQWGLSWPWKKMTEATRGIRFGETIYLAAAEKTGKSEIVNAIAAHLIKEHGLKVMLAKPEEANKKTYKLLLGKLVGKVFHDPKVEFDEEAYERAGKIAKDKACMLNLYQHIDFDTLKYDIECAVAQGVKAVFIDPITNLTNRMGSSERNDALMGISEELAAMAKDLDIVIFIFCHLNKPPKGMTPFDRGGKITTDFFAGSSAMARSCNYAIGMQCNKDPELPEETRNLRDLVLLADREYGESTTVSLFWDKETSLFREV